MKLLVISDFHFGPRLNTAKLKYYQQLFASVDKIIINGDLWDRYRINFDHFVQSGWRNLFPLLKAKEAIYIFGNHDPEADMDERMQLFSVEQRDFVKLQIGGRSFHIEHGHELLHDYKILYQRPPGPLSDLAVVVGDNLENLYVTLTGTHNFTKPVNKIMRRKFDSLVHADEILVTGHTHQPEFDLEGKYINTGFNRHHFAQYLLIDDATIELITGFSY